MMAVKIHDFNADFNGPFNMKYREKHVNDLFRERIGIVLDI